MIEYVSDSKSSWIFRSVEVGIVVLLWGVITSYDERARDP